MITKNMIKAGLGAQNALRPIHIGDSEVIENIYEAMCEQKNKDAIKEYQAYYQNKDKLCTCAKQA